MSINSNMQSDTHTATRAPRFQVMEDTTEDYAPQVYSLHLRYWYKSTNTDAKLSSQAHAHDYAAHAQVLEALS